MKKLLTVLLTLIMAICLVNFNNSHTKAENGNATYTYTWNGSTWTPDTAQASYNRGDKITLVNNGADGIGHSINGNETPISSGSSIQYTVFHNRTTLTLSNTAPIKATITDMADYIYAYINTLGTGFWIGDYESSYSAGKTIDIVSYDNQSAIDLYINDEFVKILRNEIEFYTIQNNGAKIILINTGEAYITDTVSPQPEPTPSPSEPIVKDESCEKVIGPTWHWNNDKGVCEEYATVGTSTR